MTVSSILRLPRVLLSTLLSILLSLALLAVSAAACEGGGAPTAPIEEEQFGTGNPGAPKVTPCLIGKTVNCSTGNETEQQTDISIGGRGPGLRVVLTYNALAAAKAKEAGPWGFGWTGPYSARLEINKELATATVHQENGSAVAFYKSGETYTQGSWVEARLAKSGENYIYTLPNQSKLEFNSEGRLTKETDNRGNSITLAYNKSNQLETATDGAKRALTFKYNGEGLVESVTDPMGHKLSYGYTSKQLSSVTIEAKVRWEFAYESPHLLTKVTDGLKHSTTNEYDASRRVIKQTRAGHERKFKYGATAGTETTLTEPNGSETFAKFNAAGEPTKIIRAKGKGEETTTEYEYSSTTYNRTKLIDPNKHETKYGYDGEGNKSSETDPSKNESKWTYDKKHNVETETTPEGETTTIKRNEAGDPKVIERPINEETQKTEYKYNEKGDLSEAIDPLKHSTTYTYDEAGDKKSETDPEGNEATFKYNEDSQMTEATTPRKLTTKTERDEQGRAIKVTDPLTHVTKYEYDANGNVESETDANKHTTKYTYDEEDHPTAVEQPNTTIVKTGYDAEGRMTSRTDGNEHTWEYKRNGLEQIIEEVDPLKRKTKKNYEKAGGLETLEDPTKNTTTYKYDESNRLKSIVYSTGKPSEVTYEYNKDSKVTKMSDGTGETKNAYDKLDRLTEYKNGAGKIVKYAYDLNNNPTKITYPNKETVTRAYDKDARLEKVTDWNKQETTFKYNADSGPSATTFPSGTEGEDTYAYDEADRMSEVKFKKGATSLGTLVYERDPVNQLKKTTATVLPGPASDEHAYDENNRLKESNKAAYAYDPANNPTKLEGAGPYSYDEADQLKEGPEGKYAYSEDGQRTKITPGKGPATTYGYDQAGSLTSVERPKEEPLAEINDGYGYDGDKLRESQTISGTTTQLTWDTAEGLPLLLSDETNSYIYGPGGLPIEQISSGGTTLYLHHDQQGSTRLLTNATGETETAYTYNPFGTLNATTGTASTPLRYDGQYTSTDTGLTYLGAQTYDPATGQFLTVDPALRATGEPYAYAKGNPEKGPDATGIHMLQSQPPRMPPTPADSEVLPVPPIRIPVPSDYPILPPIRVPGPVVWVPSSATDDAIAIWGIITAWSAPAPPAHQQMVFLLPQMSYDAVMGTGRSIVNFEVDRAPSSPRSGFGLAVFPVPYYRGAPASRNSSSYFMLTYTFGAPLVLGAQMPPADGPRP
jgi:RHS repeat-associated protein